MSVGNATKYSIYQELLNNDKSSDRLGIPLTIRKVRGRKVGQRKNKDPNDAFVEFILPNSVNKLLKIASTIGLRINGRRAKCFKSGSKPDYMLVKKRIHS